MVYHSMTACSFAQTSVLLTAAREQQIVIGWYSAVLQVFNGIETKAEEFLRAQEMFQAMHEARTAASRQPLNELVG